MDNASLQKAKLGFVDLRGASLKGATLEGAYIYKAKFDNDDLEYAKEQDALFNKYMIKECIDD